MIFWVFLVSTLDLGYGDRLCLINLFCITCADKKEIYLIQFDENFLLENIHEDDFIIINNLNKLFIDGCKRKKSRTKS